MAKTVKCFLILMCFVWSILPTAAKAETVTADTFFNACRSKAEASDAMSVPGRDGWLFLNSELKHLGKGAFWGDAAQRVNATGSATSRDPMAAIVSYKKALAEAGIDLLLVPVPAKAIVYPEKLDSRIVGPLPRLDLHHQTFYALLREQGVEVLDVTPLLIEGRKSAQVYCRTDTHYSPQGLKLVAAAVAEKVKEKDWYEAVPKSTYTITRYEKTVTGDLLREYDGPNKPAPETVVIEEIAPPDGAPAAVNSTSPIVVLADSHGLIFHDGDDMLAERAGLVDHLARELGMPIDLHGTLGSGATPTRVSFYRAARRDPGYIAGKKFVVWLLTVREFTESSWNARVPVGVK
jgi:hypothetical protein